MNLIPATTVTTMSSREIADLAAARHNDVVATIDRLFDKGLLRSGRKSRQESTGGRPVDVYDLIERDVYLVISGYSDEVRARIVDRWQELEEKLAQLPKFDPASLSRMDILKLAMDSEQRAIEAEAARDHAVATKAQIGSRREATAMANVANANREVARLKDQLGFSVRQATILQVEEATGQDFDFLPLRRWCQANEVVAESVPDKRYPKGVKAWPAAAWQAVYGVDLRTQFNH